MKFFKDFGCQENPDKYSDQKSRWPQNSCEIPKGFWSELFSRIRWPRNCYRILQGFWLQFWWPALLSDNSDDYRILQELDDHWILAKFLETRWHLIRIFQEIDDHGILVKFFKDFYQNSGDQSYYPNSGILMKF